MRKQYNVRYKMNLENAKGESIGKPTIVLLVEADDAEQARRFADVEITAMDEFYGSRHVKFDDKEVNQRNA